MFHRLVAHDRKSGLWGVIQGGEGPNTTFQVAHTYACILAPQAVGALLRFTVLHEEDPSLPADDDWVDVGIGAPGWRALAAPQAEPATLRWALDTVVAPHIAAAPPGSQVIYRQDALAVRRLRYVHDAQTLDLMAHSAVAIGTALRGATAAWPRHAFATELPPPFWYGGELRKRARLVKSRMIKQPTFVGLDIAPYKELAAKLERVSREFGMQLEDPVTFHRAFPNNSILGSALGVWRGTLPGTNVHGRLLAMVERGYPSDDPLGIDGVILPVHPEAPVVAEKVSDTEWLTVGDGLLGLRRMRDTAIDPATYVALSARAVACGRERGLL